MVIKTFLNYKLANGETIRVTERMEAYAFERLTDLGSDCPEEWITVFSQAKSIEGLSACIQRANDYVINLKIACHVAELSN